MQVGVVYSGTGPASLAESGSAGRIHRGRGHRALWFLKQFPHVALAERKLGIFGRVVKPDAVLKAGDRVEIYRPIIADPETVPRRDTGGEE